LKLWTVSPESPEQATALGFFAFSNKMTFGKHLTMPQVAIQVVAKAPYKVVDDQ